MKEIKPVLICIIGVDGVGKTTHAQKLTNRLKNEGVRCRYTWFRFYHFLSLLLLAYCRLVGLTVYKTKNGQKIGYHEFYRSKMVSFLYPWVRFIDILPLYFAKIFLPLCLKYTIICDRFIYDTLADLMIDLNDFHIYSKIIGKLYTRLIPKNTKAIVLDLDESIIRERRGDLVGDKSLELRRRAYHRIAEVFELSIVENKSEIEVAQEAIVREIRRL